MWTVAKVKCSEINVFKEKLTSQFGESLKFYIPKICCQRYVKNKLKKFEKNILKNYNFYHHEDFCKTKTLSQIKFVKGLQYFLSGHIKAKMSKNFIKTCKTNENDEGFIKPIFLKN